MGYTPKSFLVAFLTTDNLPIAVQRRYWSTPTGWPSTLRLLGTIRNFSSQKQTGKARWENFILEEVLPVIYLFSFFFILTIHLPTSLVF
jgi:uncharacterized membrane protein